MIVRNGRCLAVEHIESLALPDYKKVVAFLNRVKDNGPLDYSIDKSRKLADDLFELKPTKEVRLPYFFDGRKRLIITHGFTKKRGKTPRVELNLARHLRAEYLSGGARP